MSLPTTGMPNRSIDADAIREVLSAALRAPSAHNAQPWRLTPSGENSYLLWYSYADKLRADPDDRDGLMAVGAFYETLRLTAERHGLRATIELSIRMHSEGIDIGVIAFSAPVGEPED